MNMDPIQPSVAQANGRGSASRVVAVTGVMPPVAILPDAIAPLSEQLAEFRAAARAYYTHSDLTSLTREGLEAADRLAQLLGYPGDAA